MYRFIFKKLLTNNVEGDILNLQIKNGGLQHMETKRDKFVRLTEKRMENVLKGISLLGNLANTSNYEYTEADTAKIIKTLKTFSLNGILCVGIILTASGGAQNNLPYSRLWQTAKPIAVLRLRRRTFFAFWQKWCEMRVEPHELRSMRRALKRSAECRRGLCLPSKDVNILRHFACPTAK